MALALSMLVIAPLGLYLWADASLDRRVDLGLLPDRPPRGRGTNYLIVGSDSRKGLSAQAKKELHTGSADGRRTDSMILLHTGAHGTTMVSLPRDSWVTIPPFIRPETGTHHRAAPDKLNAAFSIGGPDLLVRTVERNTGLRVDHYVEIGFRGFVDIVDKVGGIRMCLDKEVKDKDSGADLSRGCHTLDGAQSLALVRERHQEAQGDLGRTRNQQRFLSALADRASTPEVLYNPRKIYTTADAALGTLKVDKSMDLWDLASLLRAMRSVTRGKGARVNVPLSAVGVPSSKGSTVRWDRTEANKLFTELRRDQPVGGEKHG
ncbi:LCP family protein [Wenjunlia tyrosinilytica]|uniref:Transcriptional regulator n=1 Tax=Wenjunlia tyrosinilytica TaxID=1544741 RepID=A0A917ZU45_9ACTN|nr:LCP family protein [Wenjunlia tyrosinilytica]GGO91741.1 transcriptional regulator [Wenjunlia tyrosinilytica]